MFLFCISIEGCKDVVSEDAVSSEEHLKGSKPLGKMTAFWRTCMMTGGNDQISPWHLYKNPVAYLDNTDFPYNYSKYGLTENDEFVLHGDVASYVRFLSTAGDDTYDLAKRDNGKIVLQKKEVRKRFAKTEASGAIKNYIIVLDNIPFCFPKQENIRVETYGQTALPEDMNEWKEFIVDLCKELKAVLGEEKANTLSFRLGTEAHNGNRFHYSDPAVMLNFYKITAQAVKSVLPKAKFGPYNTHTPWRLETQTLNFPDLVYFCMKNNLPLDFIGYSWYTQGSRPLTKADGFIDHWKNAEFINPELKNVPKEFHEFGSLGEKGNQYMRPSSDNAAAMFNMLMDAKAGGFTGTFHWPVDVKLTRVSSTHVLNGLGWMFQVLDHTTGGNTYLFDYSVVGNASYSDIKVLGVFNCDNNKSFLIVSSFNPNIDNEIITENIKIEIPGEFINLPTNSNLVKGATLDRETCPLLAIRKDLEQAGLLTEPYLSRPFITPYFPVHYVIDIPSVTSIPSARNVIEQNRNKYIELCKNSLTLKDKSVSIAKKTSGYELIIPTKTNSISVIELKN